MDLHDEPRLVAEPHLEDARQSSEYSLWIKGPGTVDPLGCGIAVDVVHGEEDLENVPDETGETRRPTDPVDVAGDASDTAGVVVGRSPVVETPGAGVAGVTFN